MPNFLSNIMNSYRETKTIAPDAAKQLAVRQTPDSTIKGNNIEWCIKQD